MALIAGPFPPAIILGDTTGNLFEVLCGATIKEVMPCGVIASLGGNSIYTFRFDIGPLPSGTMKLLHKSRTSDTGAHASKWNVSWNVATTATDVDALTLNAVTGNTTTISNDTSHAWAITETKITMDGSSTMVADRAVYVQVTAVTSGWTVNGQLGFSVDLIWE